MKSGVAGTSEQLVYNYDEVLGLVEKFMVDSGIRAYCTEQCQGHCCEQCRELRPETCSKTDGRRLVCSVFLCTEMDRLLWQLDGYECFQNFCAEIIRYVSNLYYFYRYEQDGNNPFFYPPSALVIASFHWPRSLVGCALSPLLALKIQEALAEVGSETRRPVRRSCF